MFIPVQLMHFDEFVMHVLQTESQIENLKSLVTK